MRIIIVLREFDSPSNPVGEEEIQAARLANHFRNRGALVRIVCGKWDWGQPSDDRIGKIPVDRHFTAWDMFGFRGLRRFSPFIYLISLFIYLFSHRKEYDIIHYHDNPIGAYVVSRAGKWFGKKTVIRSMASGAWGNVQYGNSFIKAQWMKFRVADVDCFVAENANVEKELSALGIEPKKIIRIPNGVEIAPENPKKGYEFNGKFNVLFVGRLHPQKGIDTLLQALKLAVDITSGVEWKLKITGNGILMDSLEKLSTDLSIEPYVEFMGEVDNLESLYMSSDLFTLPSRSEGISNALLEAMAHGLPCVATDIPGNNDIIEDGENGLLIPADDIEALAKSMIILSGLTELRRKIGEAGYRLVLKEYSLNKIVDQYLRLYGTLLGS